MTACLTSLVIGYGSALATVTLLLGLGMWLVNRSNRADELVGPVGRSRLP